MCSTCGCGKKADTFEAPKRQRIGNRFISRRKDGTISKNVDVGRSLSADRRRKAKTTASAGQGDKGDLKRAESFEADFKPTRYKKKGWVITRNYEDYMEATKGNRHIQIHYNKGDYEPYMMYRTTGSGEYFFKTLNDALDWLNGDYPLYEGGKDFRNAESFEAESKFDKLSNEIAKDYEKKGKSKDEAEKIGKATAYKIGVAKYGKRGMERKARAGRAKNAESFGADGIDMNRNRDRSNIHYQLFNDPSFRQRLSFGLSNPSYGGYIGYTTNPYAGGAVGLNIGYYSYGRNVKTGEQWEQWAKGRMTPEQFRDFEQGVEDGMDSSPDDYEDFDGGLVCGCGEPATIEVDKGNVHTCAFCFGVMVGKAKVEIPIIEEAISENMGAESFGADEKKRSGMKIAPKIQMVNYQDVMTEKMKNQNMKDAESFGADFTTVQRPHHVARVRNDRIGGGKHGLERWNKPNMHTDQNKLGKMYDEERGGWVEMDDKARSMFEEIGGKISDFDVVGTTQDVVGKTGFNIPTGVASIAVVFMAYMTGKKYGN